MSHYTATYSPDDNKLRLYASSRLDAETYARVKAAGFKWAPKQDLFVAPMWTPGREDLLIELAGEIEDEDKSLVERQEERAERFDGYYDNRTKDAEQARKAVSAIADNIPFGQPILVGHHSERHARKDAERIENGMRKAVKMWETAKYWQSRAAGALAHAKYKELPAVRARRIKTIEADQRKMQRYRDNAARCLDFWSRPDHTIEQATAWAAVHSFDMPRKEGDRPDFNQCPTAHTALTGEYPSLYAPRTLEEVISHAKRTYPAIMARCDRWLAHYANRLEYEKAMLDEQGASDLIAKKPRKALLPICNYRQPDGFQVAKMYHRGETELYPQVDMTTKEYAAIQPEMKGTRIIDNSHRVRVAVLESPTSRYSYSRVAVFLTDSKAHPKPGAIAPTLPPPPAPRPEPAYRAPEPTIFDAMKDSLKAGVQTVTAPQLFPTPPDLAARMAHIADIQPGHSVLEPSAGTGNLIKAFPCVRPSGYVVAVEVNCHLADTLQPLADEIHQADFLACNGELGTFDRIVMNPPFTHGEDIKHILHARAKLNPGGKLVALCANGPRQQDTLKPLADYWEDLPAGSFKAEGTAVNVALLVIEA